MQDGAISLEEEVVEIPLSYLVINLLPDSFMEILDLSTVLSFSVLSAFIPVSIISLLTACASARISDSSPDHLWQGLAPSLSVQEDWNVWLLSFSAAGRPTGNRNFLRLNKSREHLFLISVPSSVPVTCLAVTNLLPFHRTEVGLL